MADALDPGVEAALIDHGRTVVTQAAALAPSRTGRLRAALTSTYTAGTLTVDAGTATAPHAYTMHATALGKANGGMTFTVPAHSRRGYPVSGYRAKRRIPNRPYLIQAWQKNLSHLSDTITAAVAKVVT